MSDSPSEESWPRSEWESYAWLFFTLLVVLFMVTTVVEGLGGKSSWWKALVGFVLSVWLILTFLAHTRWFWKLGKYRILNPTSWEDVRAGRRRY